MKTPESKSCAEIEPGRQHATRSVVISEDGAALRVEKIEITDSTRRGLTTRLKSIGSPSGSGRPSASIRRRFAL